MAKLGVPSLLLVVGITAAAILASGAYAQQPGTDGASIATEDSAVVLTASAKRKQTVRARARNAAICAHESDCRLCCADQFGNQRCVFDVWLCGQ
jgi:hypothetical protein